MMKAEDMDGFADHIGGGGGILCGASTLTETVAAADEFCARISQPDMAAVFVFCSTRFDLEVLGRRLAENLPGVLLVGCTTAGELSPDGYRTGSLTGFSLAAPEFHVSARIIENLHSFELNCSQNVVQSNINALRAKDPTLDLSSMFGFLMIDGLCHREEAVISYLHAAMGQIPMFGGSAGDDLHFQRSFLLWEGEFRPDIAVQVMVGTRYPFRVFKTEHFTATDNKMVITGTDSQQRIVYEINGDPAGPEYARLAGLDASRLTPMSFAAHPVVVRVGGDYYVRSIQKVNPDQSLSFYCAVDEGIVLTVARGCDMLEDLQDQFSRIIADIGYPRLLIGCDCILRRLELENRREVARMSQILSAHNVIGFNTYGEQFQAMHVNQTFTGVAIGGRRA